MTGAAPLTGLALIVCWNVTKAFEGSIPYEKPSCLLIVTENGSVLLMVNWGLSFETRGSNRRERPASTASPVAKRQSNPNPTLGVEASLSHQLLRTTSIDL